jgi:hypothetical protein
MDLVMGFGGFFGFFAACNIAISVEIADGEGFDEHTYQPPICGG